MPLPIWLAGAQPVILDVTLPIRALPPGLDGTRILFLTDIHYGKWFGDRAMARLMQTMRSLKPDLLLLGGDLAENEADERRVCAHLASIQPPMGKLCVPGNNDYEAANGNYDRLREIYDAARLRLLVNERWSHTVDSGRLLVCGVDDDKYGAPNPAPLLEARDANDCTILLAHSPWSLSGVLADDVQSPHAALCGHTHGGQIALGPLSPYARAKPDPYFESTGLHDKGSMRLLVSNGIGMSLLPIRVGARPELHLLILRPENASILTIFPHAIDIVDGDAL